MGFVAPRLIPENPLPWRAGATILSGLRKGALLSWIRRNRPRVDLAHPKLIKMLLLQVSKITVYMKNLKI